VRHVVQLQQLLRPYRPAAATWNRRSVVGARYQVRQGAVAVPGYLAASLFRSFIAHDATINY
jgi:hypothetical protein